MELTQLQIDLFKSLAGLVITLGIGICIGLAMYYIVEKVSFFKKIF